MVGGLGRRRPHLTTLDVTGKYCATVTGLEPDKKHTFRLLMRMDIFELYIDDLLMQTYLYKPSSGKLGFLVRNAEAVFDDLRAWEMSLEPEQPSAQASNQRQD